MTSGALHEFADACKGLALGPCDCPRCQLERLLGGFVDERLLDRVREIVGPLDRLPGLEPLWSESER